MTMKQSFKSHARVAALLCGTLLAGAAKADQVIPDDLIVQGSLCAGLDCVNNESFGFSTIRLKENNTRIEFMDTSVGVFPSNDWMITANDSGSGGASYLAFDDVTGAKQPFRVTAGAPTASLFVDSTGRVGLRNSAPLLDLHMTTGNTPAIRLEQTNSSGFTAQTWDVAGNEANFFVRDLTTGSKLPFRIRPGAPTSSLDISAAGNVGIGTGSPVLLGGASNRIVAIEGSINPIVALRNTTSNRQWGWYVDGAGALVAFDANAVANRVAISTAGNLGIGTSTPAVQLHTTAGVRFGGVAGCSGGIQSNGSGDLSCILSSRQFKNIIGDLAADRATTNIMALRPQVGSYKETPAVEEHWLIAEDVAAVDSALVGLHHGKPHTVKTQNVVADLIAVVQQQQRRIDELEKRLAAAR
jgi:hypothetical protein